MKMTHAMISESTRSAAVSGPRREAPGPGLFRYLQTQREFMTDQVEFARSMQRRYGDVSTCYLGSYKTWFICRPDLIEEVLLKKHDAFHKDAITQGLDKLLGQGLLTSEGEYWRRQRKLAAPALKPLPDELTALRANADLRAQMRTMWAK